MKQILQEISEMAVLLNDEEFTAEQKQTKWLGYPPITDEELSQVETKLRINLPQDYIDFLKICNGFAIYSGVHPSFAPASRIDYLKNVDEDLVDIWGTFGELADVASALATSIKIGGFEEEQYFLLIPPGENETKWRYWKFASWLPGESPFNDLTHYFTDALEFLKKNAAEEGLIASDIVIDYSLRNHLFTLDWERVYDTAAELFLQNKSYYYLTHTPAYDLLHLAAGKLNRYEELAQLIHTAYTTVEEYKYIQYVLTPLEEKARNKIDFMDRVSIVEKENAPSLDQLLVQTKKQYPDLFNNEKAAVTYLLVQLFEGGKAADYIQLYEKHHEALDAYYHLKAAVVYASYNEANKAKQALNIYFDKAFVKKPLAPFNYPELIRIMDKDYLYKILQKFKP